MNNINNNASIHTESHQMIRGSSTSK